MKRQRRMLVALSTMMAGAAPALVAQESAIPLDTLRVAASSRASGELGAASRAVEVISAEAIRELPASSISDVLQWAFGVDLMPRSPALADVSLRGSSFEQVLVLVDGVRVSDAQTGHFDLNLAVPLDQVERVEVLRGSAASLHGADAMGGVINIVTRREGQGLSARAETGSFGTAGLSLSHGLRMGEVRADVAGELRRSDGHRPGTDYELGTVRLALQAPLAGNPLTADVAFAARDFGADGFYGPFPSYEKTRTTTASLGWRAQVGERLSVEPTLSLRRHGDDFVLKREDPEYYRNQHTTMQLGGELMSRYALAPGIRLAAGVEAYRDELESASLGDSTGWRQEDRAAALAELAVGRVGELTATTGVRADWYEAHGLLWSPSLSLAWWPIPEVRLRTSGGRSFRAPTWTERFYRSPANIGDPNLSPERAWSAEAGFDAQLRPGLRLSATGFVRNASELIDWAQPRNDSTAPFRTRNVDEARFRGLEVEAGVADVLGLDWVGRGSWLALTSSSEAGFRSKYALRPLTRTLSLRASRAFASGLGLSLNVLQARRAEEEAYERVDVRASYTLRDARLFVDLQNALDAEYPDITGRRAPGRALVIGAEWRGLR